MSVTIETIVSCDECGANCSADDRSKTAKRIRRDRKADGWIQIGSKDYCGKCAPKHKQRGG